MIATERFVHYSAAPLIGGVKDTAQSWSEFYKPRGLWFSVEAEGREDGWREWCQAETFRLEHLEYITELELDLGKFRVITNTIELDAFDEEFGHEFVKRVHGIHWPTVAQFHSGIIIAPYLWERRLDGRASRCYYGWDCASGCVWDSSAASIAAAKGESE